MVLFACRVDVLCDEMLMHENLDMLLIFIMGNLLLDCLYINFVYLLLEEEIWKVDFERTIMQLEKIFQ